MTAQQQQLIATLIAKWREDNLVLHRKYTDAGVAFLCCANELEAALSAHAQPLSTNAVDPSAQPSGTPTPRDEKSSSFD